MPRKENRSLFKTIVIVCEDAKVTPGYLRGFANELKDKGIWDDIAIYPLPSPEPATTKNDQPHKSPRITRKLLTVNNDPAIEDEHRQVPVRFVREAQLWKLERGYNEAWAVYDKDGHPYHQEAHTLSLTDPLVHIAFTSIAVEHWFLLHFELNTNSFVKSRDIPLNQFIRSYDSDKKAATDTYNTIRHLLNIGIVNAAWLRKLTHCEKLFYERNPYVNIDHLIFRMFGYYLVGTPGRLALKGIVFNITKDETDLNIEVTNKSKASVITHEIDFYYFDRHGQKTMLHFDRKIIKPGDLLAFSFETAEIVQLYIHMKNHTIVVDASTQVSPVFSVII